MTTDLRQFDDHIQRIRFMLLYEDDVKSMLDTIQDIDPTVSKDLFFLLFKAAEILNKDSNA